MRGSANIEISGPQDVRTIAALHTELVQAIKKSRAICFKLRRDVEVDLTFIQLVEAARRYATLNSKGLTLAEPASGQLTDMLARGGFVANAEARAFWLHEKGEC